MSPVPCVFETIQGDSGGFSSKSGKRRAHYSPHFGMILLKKCPKRPKMFKKIKFWNKKCQSYHNFVRRYRFAHVYAHQTPNYLTSPRDIVSSMGIRIKASNLIIIDTKISTYFYFEICVIFWFTEATATSHLCIIVWNKQYFLETTKLQPFLRSTEQVWQYSFAHWYTHQAPKSYPNWHQNVNIFLLQIQCQFLINRSHAVISLLYNLME